MKIIYDREEGGLGDDELEMLERAASCCLESEAELKKEASGGLLNPELELSLSTVTPEEIREINRDYRGVDSDTDVLSFPQFEEIEEIPEKGEAALGDVVISLSRAHEQASEYGHSFERELCYLFVHSVFHLLGYDHMEEADKRVMRSREESVMKKLGMER